MDPNIVLFGVAGGLAAVLFAVVLIFLVLRMPPGNERMREIADGGSSATDRELTVVTPPDGRSVGVLAFAGHNVVSADVPGDWVRNWLPDSDLSAPLQPPFLTVLAAATGRTLDNLDMVLVARATGRESLLAGFPM